MNHVVTDFNQHGQNTRCVTGIAARLAGLRCGDTAARLWGRRGSSAGVWCGAGGRCRLCVIGYVIVVLRGLVVGVILLGLVVVDDGRIGNVSYGFVFLVDGRVLGVDVGEVGAVVGVDVAVPCVVVDGDVVCGGYAGIAERLYIDGNSI